MRCHPQSWEEEWSGSLYNKVINKTNTMSLGKSQGLGPPSKTRTMQGWQLWLPPNSTKSNGSCRMSVDHCKLNLVTLLQMLFPSDPHCCYCLMPNSPAAVINPELLVGSPSPEAPIIHLGARLLHWTPSMMEQFIFYRIDAASGEWAKGKTLNTNSNMVKSHYLLQRWGLCLPTFSSLLC